MRRLLIFGALPVLLVACTSQTDEQSEMAKTGAVDTAFTRDAALYHEAAEKLVGDFAGDLKGELTAALADQGAVSTIGICANVAPEIAAAHAAGGWTVRRVSNRSRNPDNRASTNETVILLGFSDAATSPPFVETWEGSDTARTYYYYQPIRTMPLCLKCHGGLQTLEPGVMEALRREYPSDRATGYVLGELRGMFVVEAPWPDGKAYAEQLLTDSLLEEEL